MQYKEFTISEKDMDKYASEKEKKLIKENESMFNNFEKYKAHIEKKYKSKIANNGEAIETKEDKDGIMYIYITLENGLKIKTLGMVGLPRDESEMHTYKQTVGNIGEVEKGEDEEEKEEEPKEEENKDEELKKESIKRLEKVLKENVSKNSFTTQLSNKHEKRVSIYGYKEEEDEKYEVNSANVIWNVDNLTEYRSWGIKEISPSIEEVKIYYKDGHSEDLGDYKINIMYSDGENSKSIVLYPIEIEVYKNDKIVDVTFLK